MAPPKVASSSPSRANSACLSVSLARASKSAIWFPSIRKLSSIPFSIEAPEEHGNARHRPHEPRAGAGAQRHRPREPKSNGRRSPRERRAGDWRTISSIPLAPPRLNPRSEIPVPKPGKRKAPTGIPPEEPPPEVPRMRHASDRLLTGIGTALADDPLLTDRSGLSRRRKLLRVILDSRLRLPLKSKLVKTADEDVLVMTAQPSKNPCARALEKAGIEIFQIRGRGGRLDFKAVLGEVGKRGL